MPATTYPEEVPLVASIQGRTDPGGLDVSDVSGADLRLLGRLFSAGVVNDGMAVTPQGGNMNVVVGLTQSLGDVAVVAGVNPGQGHYVASLTTAPVLTLPASDVVDDRVDNVYLVVRDDPYDASGVARADVALVSGDPGAGDPGPDGSWDAFLLLASITVPAGAIEVTAGNISDERVSAVPGTHAHPYLPLTGGTMAGAINMGGYGVTGLGLAVAATDALSQAAGDARYFQLSQGVDWSAINNVPATFTPSAHVHDGTDITTGTIDGDRVGNLDASKITTGTIADARLPSATTSVTGIVKLSASTSSTSQTLAATASAVKAAYDLANGKANSSHSHSYAPTTALSSHTGTGRKITVSTSNPSGGSNGDVWFKV